MLVSSSPKRINIRNLSSCRLPCDFSMFNRFLLLTLITTVSVSVTLSTEATVGKEPDPSNPEAMCGPFTVSAETLDLPDSHSKDPHMDKMTVYYPSGLDETCSHSANVTSFPTTFTSLHSSN